MTQQTGVREQEGAKISCMLAIDTGTRYLVPGTRYTVPRCKKKPSTKKDKYLGRPYLVPGI